MNPDESPTIEQLVERLPTDRILALMIHQLLKLQAEVEIVRELVSEQTTATYYDVEKEAFEERIREKRMKLVAALTREWSANVDTEDSPRG